MDTDEPGQLHDASDEEPEPSDEAAGSQDERGARDHSEIPTLSNLFDLPIMREWLRVDWPTSFKHLTECYDAAGVTELMGKVAQDALSGHLSALGQAAMRSLMPQGWPAVLESLTHAGTTSAMVTLGKLNATGVFSTNAHPLTIGMALAALRPRIPETVLRDASAALDSIASDVTKSFILKGLGVDLQRVLPDVTPLSELSAFPSVLRESMIGCQDEMARVSEQLHLSTVLLPRPPLLENRFHGLWRDPYPEIGRHVERDRVEPPMCPWLGHGGAEGAPSGPRGTARCETCLRLFAAGLAAGRNGRGATFLPPCVQNTAFASFLMTTRQSTMESSQRGWHDAVQESVTPDEASPKVQSTRSGLEQLKIVVSGEIRGGTRNVVTMGSLEVFLDNSEFELFLRILLACVLDQDGIDKDEVEAAEYRGRSIDQRLHSLRRQFDTALASLRIDREQFIRARTKGRVRICVLPENVHIAKAELLRHEVGTVRILASLFQ